MTVFMFYVLTLVHRSIIVLQYSEVTGEILRYLWGTKLSCYAHTKTVFMFYAQVLSLVTVVVCRIVKRQIRPPTHRPEGRAFFLPGVY